MPLIEAEKLEKIYLPSTAELADTEKEWVVMDVSPLKGADLDAITEAGEDTNVMKFFGQIVTLRIREWNVTDDGELATVTEENIKRLPFEDRAFLFSKIDQGGQALPKAPPSS